MIYKQPNIYNSGLTIQEVLDKNRHSWKDAEYLVNFESGINHDAFQFKINEVLGLFILSCRFWQTNAITAQATFARIDDSVKFNTTRTFGLNLIQVSPYIDNDGRMVSCGIYDDTQPDPNNRNSVIFFPPNFSSSYGIQIFNTIGTLK